MADIELRFGRDMLVLSAPIDRALARQGIDAPRDRQYLNLMEPDAISDALQLEVLAGAQCVVTTTEDITRARLAHVRMEKDAAALARAAVDIVAELKPQHVLAEIGPCGLPLDAASKASLNENRAQYADAARAFDNCDFDAFFLNGFASVPDLKCALMGVAQVSGKPVFASVAIGVERVRDAIGAVPAPKASAPAGAIRPDDDATLFDFGLDPLEGPLAPAVPVPNAALDPEQWPEALGAMEDLGASVVGFETADPLDRAIGYARQAVQCSGLPVLAQLRVQPTAADAAGAAGSPRSSAASARALSLVPLSERTDYALETMEHAAAKLYGAGVQFLRATGAVTPAFTGALAATVSGLDVRARQ